MNLSDVAMSISPIFAPYVVTLQELEIAEQRRKNEASIARAMGIPAEFLFNSYVQRFLAGPIVRPMFDVRPISMMRRKVRKTYGI